MNFTRLHNIHKRDNAMTHINISNSTKNYTLGFCLHIFTWKYYIKESKNFPLSFFKTTYASNSAEERLHMSKVNAIIKLLQSNCICYYHTYQYSIRDEIHLQQLTKWRGGQKICTLFIFAVISSKRVAFQCFQQAATLINLQQNH